MASPEQIRNTLATVAAMVDGAGQVMQRLHPEVTIRPWRDLTEKEQMGLAKTFFPMLAPLGTILAGRVASNLNADGKEAL